MVTTFYPPYNFGGDGIFVQRLSNELARRGHHVDVVHCLDSYRLKARELRAPPLPQGAQPDHPNVTVHPLESRFGFLSPLATQQTGFPLFKSRQIREILAQPFDVIHFHNVSLVGGPRVLEYGDAIKLYTIHEYWLVCQTHVMFKYNRYACTTPNCLTCTLVHRRPPQWWRHMGLLPSAARHVDAFIAPSRFTQRLHQEQMPAARIEHLPHFVPAAEPAPSVLDPALERAMDEPFFLYAGRLEKLKGVHTLIPVFRQYPRARLLIAGAGGSEGELRRLADASDRIVLLGRRSSAELQALYQRAVAVLVPSTCPEVFGLVPVEAFTHHTPVIARNLGALPEIIEESGGGIGYDSEDELVAALNRMLDDPCERRAMGERGFQAYEERWSTDVHMERYAALIEQIGAQRRGGRVVGAGVS
jgi:glycosyltransferase involved in cell wall biosynthesis